MKKIMNITQKMKSNVFWIIVISVVAILFGIILWQSKRSSRYFNKYEFSEEIVVKNITNNDRIDTLALVLADKVFKFDNLDLMIAYFSDALNNSNITFNGMVYQYPFGKNKFIIFLNDKMNFLKMKSVISHEFIHIDQCINGDLEIRIDYAIWKGDTIYFSNVKYDQRPFEIEARKLQNKITRKLNKYLYK